MWGWSGISIPGMTFPLRTIFWTFTPNPGTVFLSPRGSGGLRGGLLLSHLLLVTLGALLAGSEPQFPLPSRRLPRHAAPTRGQCWPGFGAAWHCRNFSASCRRVGNFSPRAAPVPPAPTAPHRASSLAVARAAACHLPAREGLLAAGPAASLSHLMLINQKLLSLRQRCKQRALETESPVQRTGVERPLENLCQRLGGTQSQALAPQVASAKGRSAGKGPTEGVGMGALSTSPHRFGLAGVPSRGAAPRQVGTFYTSLLPSACPLPLRPFPSPSYFLSLFPRLPSLPLFLFDKHGFCVKRTLSIGSEPHIPLSAGATHGDTRRHTTYTHTHTLTQQAHHTRRRQPNPQTPHAADTPHTCRRQTHMHTLQRHHTQTHPCRDPHHTHWGHHRWHTHIPTHTLRVSQQPHLLTGRPQMHPQPLPILCSSSHQHALPPLRQSLNLKWVTSRKVWTQAGGAAVWVGPLLRCSQVLSSHPFSELPTGPVPLVHSHSGW